MDFFIKKKNLDSISELEEITYTKVAKKYYGKKLDKLTSIFRFLAGCLLAFIFGFNLFYCQGDFFETILFFLVSFIFCNKIIPPIHEILHFIIFPKDIIKGKIYFEYESNPISIKTISENTYSKILLIISLLLPLLIISSITITLLYTLGFNYLVYSVFVSNIIISIDDILNIFILLKSKSTQNQEKYTVFNGELLKEII